MLEDALATLSGEVKEESKDEQKESMPVTDTQVDGFFANNQ